MDYSNPKIPEGINVSQEHPLKDFAWMLAGVGLATVLIIALLTWLAEYLVRFIPFEMEQRLAEHFVERTLPNEENFIPQTATYLNSLAQDLALAQQAPHPIRVHYLDTDQVNAFATLGGNIIVTRGLLEKMPSENALAMVISHEIAHISHRDPIVAAGRGLTVGLALMSLAGAGDSAMAQQLIGHLNLLTQLSFNRSAETAADQRALATLLAHYGHVKDADALFNYLQKLDDNDSTMALLSTHPLHRDRIVAIQNFGNRQGQVTPLPDNLLPKN